MKNKSQQSMRERRERGTGRLFLRGRVWWAQYYSHGRQIRVSTEETDEKRAGKFLKHKLAEVVTGTHVDVRNLTYGELRAGFFLDYETQRRRSIKRDGEGKPSTDAVRRLDDYFTGYRVADIDTEQVRRFQKEQQEKGLSNASINRSTSSLRRMFNIARKEGRFRDVPYFPMLKENSPRKGFFEKADYEALAKALPDYARLPLAIGYFTGMRRGEVFCLAWKQVDLMKKVITLYAGETKNGEGRVIPIPRQLEILLRERFAKRHASCPYVCYRFDRRGQAVRIGELRKVWESRCIKVGLGEMVPVTDSSGEPVVENPRCDRPNAKPRQKLKYVGKTFHDLRRSAVRNMVRGGVPERVAMAISGHKTRSVFDRYNIVSGADLDVARAQMANYYDREKVGDNSGTIVSQPESAELPVF
jgi:integrase